MAQIFISYAREDLETAQRLAEALEVFGWSVFWDRRIPAGQHFDSFIEEQIKVARCVIVLWSEAALVSEWVLEEAGEGRNRGILTPARIEAVEPPFGFRRIHSADLIGWRGSQEHPGFAQLIEDIKGLSSAEISEKRRRVEAEGKREAEDEKCRQADAEAKLKAEQRRQRADAEAKLKAEQRRQRAEAEAKREAEEKDRRVEAEARREAEDEKCRQAEAEAKRRASEEEDQGQGMQGAAVERLETARSAEAIPWFLFAGATITAFVLPVMLFVTNLAPPLGLFHDALSWETMSSFVGFWLVKLVLFGIIGFGLWHAAHRLRSCAHDLGIRADDAVAVVLYGLAGVGTLLTIWALLRI